MNREQRRKLGVKEKKKSYTITEDTLEDLQKLSREKAIEDMIKLELMVTLMVLRDHYGFGKKRLNEFAKHHRDLLDSIEKGYVEYLDMYNTIEDETGFDYLHWVDKEDKKENEERLKELKAIKKAKELNKKGIKPPFRE